MLVVWTEQIKNVHSAILTISFSLVQTLRPAKLPVLQVIMAITLMAFARSVLKNVQSAMMAPQIIVQSAILRILYQELNARNHVLKENGQT